VAVSCPGQKTNYSLLRNKEKAQREKIDAESVPLVRKAILEILEEDYNNWTKQGLTQPGVEKNILISKVGAKTKVVTAVFEYVLEDLEGEQLVLPVKDESLTRFIYLNLEIPDKKQTE